jgi:hypothetical protein
MNDFQGSSLSKILDKIMQHVQQALACIQQDPVKVGATIKNELQCFSAILRGIQLVEEDLQTGAPLPLSIEERKAFLGVVEQIMNTCWATMQSVVELYRSDEEVIGVSCLNFCFQVLLATCINSFLLLLHSPIARS